MYSALAQARCKKRPSFGKERKMSKSRQVPEEFPRAPPKDEQEVQTSTTAKGVFAGPTGRRNMMVAGGAVVVLVLAIFAYTKMGRSAEAAREEKRVRFADEVQQAEDEDAELRLKAERMSDLAGVQRRLMAINNTERQVQINAGELQKNAANMSQFMGGESKAGYDEDMSAFEDEQSLSTAFMIKDDIDKKKHGINQLQQELGLERQHLGAQLQQDKAALHAAVSHYRSKYNDQEVDPLVQQAEAVLRPTPAMLTHPQQPPQGTPPPQRVQDQAPPGRPAMQQQYAQ